MAGQTCRDTGGHESSGLGIGGGRIHVRGGRGAGVRAAADRGTADRTNGAHPLVQLVRLTSGMAGNDPTSRGRRIVLLSALLHGIAEGGWNTEDGAPPIQQLYA